MMLQARRAADINTDPVGQFSNLPPDTGTLDCESRDDAFVHTSSDDKSDVTVTWSASDIDYGDIVFV